MVATTTGERPKMVTTQLGNVESAAVAWEIPMPSAAASPTIEELR